ncbi:hypothetical protein KA005_46530, partial [bacterium]|nr:hypothetical protein [bacterium]
MFKKSYLKEIFSFVLVLVLMFSLLNSAEINSKKPRYGGVFRLKSFDNVFRMQLDPASPESYVFLSEQIYDGLV